MKNYYLLILFVLLFACESEPHVDPEPTFFDKIQSTFNTEVNYSYWDFVYDSQGEVSYLEYYEDNTTINEVEILLTDFDTGSFQINGLHNSLLVDIPAKINEAQDRLEFEHEFYRLGNSFRVYKGFATISNDSLKIQSIIAEHGIYYPGSEIFESYLTEVGVKKQ